MTSSTQVTQLLNAVNEGEPHATDELVPLVYDELRMLARSKMALEQGGQTLQPTALVHEAYLRLVGNNAQHWNSRGHFFCAAAEAMRRILIERARHKRSQKGGGDFQRVDWSELNLAVEADDERLLLVDEALQKLEEKDPEAVQLIKLRFFIGLSGQEAARALNIPERTATRTWAYARAWLLKEIGREV